MVDLRAPTTEDLARFKECLEQDPDHAGQDADAWISKPGELLVFYDQHGNRIFVRIEKVLRVSIQHDAEAPERAVGAIIRRGFHWLQGEARKNGFTEVIFESRASRLIQFLHKLFGFEPVRENYNLCVDRPALKQSIAGSSENFANILQQSYAQNFGAQSAIMTEIGDALAPILSGGPNQPGFSASDSG